ncbi:hypothetical protein [Nocardia tengchongensis]|uniref:hypothetical protein n=1 Tax=Nocardia tengchongensis TaxID=2055889 RepID=UPI0036494495
MIATLAILILAALLLFALGPLLLRVVGAAMTVLSLIALTAGDDLEGNIAFAVLGATIWLAGHILTAWKTRKWKSRLAEQLVTGTPLRVLNPLAPRQPREPDTAAEDAEPASPNPAPAQQPRNTHAAEPVTDHFGLWEKEFSLWKRLRERLDG